VPEQSSPEEIERRRARALDVVRRLRGGTDFAQVAASFSDGPEALQGGGLGWRDQDRLPELFVDALVRMKPGEISEPLRSPAGFHVLLLLEKRGAGSASAASAPVQQQRVRHILMRTNELVSERDARQRMLSLRERIENGADFAELARVHSEDGSASKGGDLGWIYPGDTVPDFERAMNALQIMELSQPVKSPFGFHLIQVQERKLADMSDERKRMEVRRILRDRKSDEAFEEWLRQLRDRAYVELRNDDR
jgi:peptidyl-prolyl cis-trans isomerase SurA